MERYFFERVVFASSIDELTGYKNLMESYFRVIFRITRGFFVSGCDSNRSLFDYIELRKGSSSAGI